MNRSNTDLPNLDVLRSLAVLLVVVYHLTAFLGVPEWWREPLGPIGVDLFFVHTTLVLLLSLERQPSDSTLGLVRKFYVRRAFRIYPLSIATVLLISLWMASRGQAPATRTLLSNLALTMNLTADPPVLVPLWTLPLEVQMYVVLPFLFLLAPRLGLIGACGVWIGGVVAALIQLRHPATLWRLSVLAVVPNFLPGLIAYVIWRKTPKWSGALWPPVLGTVCALAFLMRSGPAYWGMSLAVGLLVPRFHQVESHLLSRAAAKVAQYSYGIYLWHLPAMWLVFGVHAPAWVSVVVVPFVIATISAVAYHALEHPMIRIGRRLTTDEPQFAPVSSSPG